MYIMYIINKYIYMCIYTMQAYIHTLYVSLQAELFPRQVFKRPILL